MGVNALAFTGHEECKHTPQGSLPLTAFGGEGGMKMLILGATAHIIGLLFFSYILLGIFVEFDFVIFSPTIQFYLNCQCAPSASVGMRQSPRGESEQLPTLGPSGRQLRLNCCMKKRRVNVLSQCVMVALS